MELMKAWALSICMACIVAGILQQIAPARARFSVIKLVLTLYILVSAFAPLQSLRDLDTNVDVPRLQAQTETVDTVALVAAQAENSLSQTLTEACQDKVSVEMENNNGSLIITQVHVQNDADAQIVQEMLGSVPIELEKEG